MDQSFAEIKLFQVKPDKTEQFEALAERMSEEQSKWEGCISIRYIKRELNNGISKIVRHPVDIFTVKNFFIVRILNI